MEQDLLDENQSAYKKWHSIETALVKVQTDLLSAIDNGGAAILVLLDCSAAFDTVDHNVLLQTLEEKFRVTSDALRWFQSYLPGRTQSVVVSNIISRKDQERQGIPQGSFSGPLLFNLHTTLSKMSSNPVE